MNDNSDYIAVVKELQILILFKYKKCLSHIPDILRIHFLGFKCLVTLSSILLRSDTRFPITQPIKESQTGAYTMLTISQFVQSEPLGRNSLLSFLSP